MDVPEGGFEIVDGHIDLDYYYGLVNIMADPFENFTVGLEFNYGNRENRYYDIEHTDTTSSGSSHIQSRAAIRISFGLFYNF